MSEGLGLRLGRTSVLIAALGACGGGAPLMYGAHALAPGEVTLGAGFSGNVPPVQPSALADDEQAVFEGALGPGLAPFVAARVGVSDSFDAGLGYTGRTVRLDGRYSFALPRSFALSLGLGASGVLPRRHDELGSRVWGFGGELPLLLGWRSSADVYAVWLGARGGAERLRGQRERAADPLAPDTIEVESLDGRHLYAGPVVGMRVGFRYLFAALELDAAMHWAEGDLGGRAVSAAQWELAPAGALIARF
jgi:hypothetical protein